MTGAKDTIEKPAIIDDNDNYDDHNVIETTVIHHPNGLISQLLVFN